MERSTCFGYTLARSFHIWAACSLGHHRQRMGFFYVSLSLLFLTHSPAGAQWWSLLWANPKTTTVPPAAVTLKSITSPELSGTQTAASERLRKENKEAEGVAADTQVKVSVLDAVARSSEGLVSGDKSAQLRMLHVEDVPGGGSKPRHYTKPLKYWKGGEWRRCKIFKYSPKCDWFDDWMKSSKSIIDFWAI